MIFRHNFWVGPIDQRSMRLNYILQNIFRDTPLKYIQCIQIRALKFPFLAVIGGVFERAKYGQVGYPWKDLAKCSSGALALGQ